MTMSRKNNNPSLNVNNLIDTEDWVTKLLSSKHRYTDIIGENKNLIGVHSRPNHPKKNWLDDTDVTLESAPCFTLQGRWRDTKKEKSCGPADYKHEQNLIWKNKKITLKSKIKPLIRPTDVLGMHHIRNENIAHKLRRRKAFNHASRRLQGVGYPLMTPGTAEITGEYLSIKGEWSKRGGSKMMPDLHKHVVHETPGPCSYNVKPDVYKGTGITMAPKISTDLDRTIRRARVEKYSESREVRRNEETNTKILNSKPQADHLELVVVKKRNGSSTFLNKANISKGSNDAAKLNRNLQDKNYVDNVKESVKGAANGVPQSKDARTERDNSKVTFGTTVIIRNRGTNKNIDLNKTFLLTGSKRSHYNQILKRNAKPRLPGKSIAPLFPTNESVTRNAPAPNLYVIREAQEQEKGLQLTFREHIYKENQRTPGPSDYQKVDLTKIKKSDKDKESNTCTFGQKTKATYFPNISCQVDKSLPGPGYYNNTNENICQNEKLMKQRRLQFTKKKAKQVKFGAKKQVEANSFTEKKTEVLTSILKTSKKTTNNVSFDQDRLPLNCQEKALNEYVECVDEKLAGLSLKEDKPLPVVMPKKEYMGPGFSFNSRLPNRLQQRLDGPGPAALNLASTIYPLNNHFKMRERFHEPIAETSPGPVPANGTIEYGFTRKGPHKLPGFLMSPNKPQPKKNCNMTATVFKVDNIKTKNISK